MQEQGTKSVLEVTPAEGGQKLLQFLQRRLSLPPTLLHRWIRTGQIRRNGGRCKPFEHVEATDTIRLPPFALAMPQPALEVSLSPLPPLLHADEQLLVFNKPAGLPVHPGTGHSDSLTTRLAAHYANAPFLPTPVHRLDKDTSGLLLVASAYSTLRALQDAFRHRHMVKEYVAWVHGLWAGDEATVLRHQLRKQYIGNDEKVRVLQALKPTLAEGTATTPADGKEAVCVVRCLRRELGSRESRSLLHIRLITGRTHQIRAQMAAVGHPLHGDVKYGAADGPAPDAQNAQSVHMGHMRLTGRKAHPPTPGSNTLYLHSLRIILPEMPELAQLPREFTAVPPWHGLHALGELPAPLTAPAP